MCQSYTRIYIKYFMIHVGLYYEYAFDTEYARVLNMIGSHMILNKILHNRYLTGFGICLEF